MKEIMICPNRSGDIISADMISLSEAIARSADKFIVSIIYDENRRMRWMQIIMTNTAGQVSLREVRLTNNIHGSITVTWQGYDIARFLNDIHVSYPRSEFYLIECMEDLCTLMIARCPSEWWPQCSS